MNNSECEKRIISFLFYMGRSSCDICSEYKISPAQLSAILLTYKAESILKEGNDWIKFTEGLM